MSLNDFIKAIKEQEDSDVVFSPPVDDDVIKVIPPSKTYNVPTKNSVVIKFKINTKPQPVVEETPIIQEEPIQAPVIHEPVEEEWEELFRLSGTEVGLKDLWYSQYKQAKASRKQNNVVKMMKQGRFALTSQGHVLILPNHNTLNKSSNDLLQEHWL